MIPIKDYSFSMRGSTDPKKSIMYKTDGININPFIIRKAIVGPDYTEPFYVEDISGSENILKIKDKTNQPVRNTIEYSFDKETWVILGTTSNTEISMTIPSNTRVYLRSMANTWSKNDGMGCPITCTGNYNVGGNLMSMLYGSDFTGEELVFPPNTNRNFRGFLACDKLVNANDLLLPATELTLQCYSSLFSGCSSLTTAPELPAMTLANSCYAWMFDNCSSLTTAPLVLPAEHLTEKCYSFMFASCSSLTKSPEIMGVYDTDETNHPYDSYKGIFQGCTSLNYIKVHFSKWGYYNTGVGRQVQNSYNWTKLTQNTTGTFVCPSGLPQYFNNSGNKTDGNYSEGWSGYSNAIPYGWTVETY